MYEFRDRIADEWGLDLIIAQNKEAIAAGMGPEVGAVHSGQLADSASVGDHQGRWVEDRASGVGVAWVAAFDLGRAWAAFLGVWAP